MTDEFARRTITLHGNQIGYRTTGAGPVLLLIHGMAGSADTWNAVAPALGQHFTIVAPDLVGHGDSAKPRGDYSLGAFASLLRDLLVALGHERATVVGQSLGGGVAMQFAYQYPERCERLVLVSSGGLGEEVNWLLRLLTLPGSEYVLPIACHDRIHDAGVATAHWLQRIGLHVSPRLEQMWSAYGSLADGPTRAAFVHTLRSVVDHNGQRVSANDRLYLAAEIPTLILWGANDRIIPVQQGIEAHAAIAGSRLEIFEGCGHFPHCERPDQFAKVLTDFVHTTQGAALSPEHFRERLLARS